MRISYIAFFYIGLTTSAFPVDVTFDGTISDTCTLALSTGGALALSTDGTVLGSEELGGLPAAMTILSIGTHTITVNAPSRTASPGGYVATGETVEIAYQGVSGLLGAVSQAYTAAQTTFPIATIPLSVLTLNSRIRNDGGFAAGSYQTRVVVTCS